MFDLNFMFNSSLGKKTELISAVKFVSHKFCSAGRFSDISKTCWFLYGRLSLRFRGRLRRLEKVLSPLWKMAWKCWCIPPLSRRPPPFRWGASPGPCSGRCSQCTSLQGRHGRSAVSHNWTTPLSPQAGKQWWTSENVDSLSIPALLDCNGYIFYFVALSNEGKHHLPISIALVAFISLMRTDMNWACSIATIILLQASSKVLCN